MELGQFSVAKPLEHLLQRYGKLYGHVRSLPEEVAVDTLFICNLIRDFDASLVSEMNLKRKLEEMERTLEAFQKKEDKDIEAKTELQTTQQFLHQVNNSYSNLQHQYEVLRGEYTDLRQQLEATKTVCDKQTANANAKGTMAEQADQLETLKRKNLELLQELKQWQGANLQHKMAITERDRSIEILHDRINSLERNLTEKTNMLKKTEEKFAGAISKSTSVSQQNTKGGEETALFAEVDDQHKAMEHLLTAQRKSYLEMKRVFLDNESEISRLKRENIAVYAEARKCSSIFSTAQRSYEDKLNRTIQHLLSQVNDLEQQLHLTEDQLTALGYEKGVVSPDFVLSYYRQEAGTLKKRLQGMHMDKLSLEEELYNAKQDMAKWRLESLMLRSELLDRESLLNKNKIPYVRNLSPNPSREKKEGKNDSSGREKAEVETGTFNERPSEPLHSSLKKNVQKSGVKIVTFSTQPPQVR